MPPQRDQRAKYSSRDNTKCKFGLSISYTKIIDLANVLWRIKKKNLFRNITKLNIWYIYYVSCVKYYDNTINILTDYIYAWIGDLYTITRLCLWNSRRKCEPKPRVIRFFWLEPDDRNKAPVTPPKISILPRRQSIVQHTEMDLN